MKILVIGNNLRGMQIFRGMLLSRLAEDGHRVTVAMPVEGDRWTLDVPGLKIIDIPMDRRGINPLKDLGLFRQYQKLIKTEKPDLVITYTIKPNVYGGMAAMLAKVPYAANITGLGTAFENPGAVKTIATTLYMAALKEAKVVFFENSENRDYFVDSGIVREDQSKLLMGAGVDLDHFAYIPYPPSDGEPFRFLFIGRVMKEKGINELLTVVNRLNAEGHACTLDILGWLEEDYEETVRTFETKGFVRYHGMQMDVREFIKAADCFVLPSWHEGMANTNLECAASGRPVITSDIPGCHEAVIDGVTGYLCKPKDVISLHDVMEKMMGLSRAEREKMGLAGRRHMEEVFDKRKVVDETIRSLFK